MSDYESYIPLYPNWLELMETKDTDEKQLAFFRGIVDAYRGEEPPRPQDLDNPHGIDYARRDGFLVARPMVRKGIRHRGAQPGNQNAKKLKENESETNDETNGKTNDKTNNETKNKTKKTNFINKKENKKENKNKKENYLVSLKRDIPWSGDQGRIRRNVVLGEWFEKFWSEYPSSCPRKYDKVKCRKKWEQLFRNAEDRNALFTSIMAGLAQWKKSRMWLDESGQYIKAPLTWLNGGCWNDAPSQNAEAAEAERKARIAAECDAKIAKVEADLRKDGLIA